MFLKDFLKHFAGAQDTYWVNVYSIEKLGRTYYITTTEEIDETSEKIASLKQDLEGEIEWRKELQKEIEGKDKQLDEQEKIIKSFDEDGFSVKELVSENEALKKQINEERKQTLDLERKIEKLQARKNKATIERDYKTGQFAAEFQGVKYTLVKQS